MPEVKRQKEIEMGPQKEPTSKDRNMKPENQYLKYIKISFPIIAVIFLAYFYRIWTRSHEKKRDEKRPQKAKRKPKTSKSQTRSENLKKLNPKKNMKSSLRFKS